MFNLNQHFDLIMNTIRHNSLLLIALSLILFTFSCNLIEPNEDNTYPNAKTELNIANLSDLSATLDIYFNGESTSYPITAGQIQNDLEFPVGPHNLYLKVGSDTLNQVTNQFLSHGQPHTIYVLGNSNKNKIMTLSHKKSYKDNGAYIRFIHGEASVNNVNIFYSTEANFSHIGAVANLEDVAFGEGNLFYNNLDAGNYTLIVANANNNVILNTTFEAKATSSKTIVIQSSGITEFNDQY